MSKLDIRETNIIQQYETRRRLKSTHVFSTYMTMLFQNVILKAFKNEGILEEIHHDEDNSFYYVKCPELKTSLHFRKI